jgi:hypothetical protein
MICLFHNLYYANNDFNLLSSSCAERGSRVDASLLVGRPTVAAQLVVTGGDMRQQA